VFPSVGFQLTHQSFAVAGIGILATMGKANDGSLVFVESLGRWISSFFAFTLTTSTTCTSKLLSYFELGKKLKSYQ